MNRFWWFLALGVGFVPIFSYGAETAQARLYCLSLRFGQGNGPSGLYQLNLTTLSSGINGELAPLPPGYSYTHWANFALHDLTLDTDVPGQLRINVPFTDANSNGFNDFFEASQSAGGTTHGILSTALGSGTVDATWSRSAGAASGTCQLTISVNGYGSLGTFTHSFDLLEYQGPLDYVPGSNTVSGSLDLAQTGRSTNTLQGPIAYVKSPTNHADELELQPGVWTNAQAQQLTFTNSIHLRDTVRLTNYYGYVVFDDGDLTTTEADYYVWLLSIDDPNDRDHNGIPDFSDGVTPTPPAQPLVGLTRGATNLFLTVSGEAGTSYDIQEAPSVPSTNWQTVLSLTLSNSTSAVSLRIPTNESAFWRAVVP